MKRFFITTFALTLFSTASVFGASSSPNNSIINFLTINGKPIEYYSQNNNQNSNQNKPNNNNSVNDCTNDNTNNSTNDSTNKPSTETPSNPNKPVEDENNSNSSVSSIEQEVVRLVNIERQKEGLSPLSIDTQLSKVARLKSEDMKNKGYFSHTSPTYGTPFDMLKQFNISYKTAGENIAKGQKSAEAVVNAWMNSEGHRRNILSKSFTHIGVGHTSNYWTQLFISK